MASESNTTARIKQHGVSEKTLLTAVYPTQSQRVGRKKHSVGFVEEGNRLLYQHSPRSSLFQNSCLVGVCSQAKKYFRDMDPSGEMLLDSLAPESANSERRFGVAFRYSLPRGWSEIPTPTHLSIFRLDSG